jgi:hypothetical protein
MNSQEWGAQTCGECCTVQHVDAACQYSTLHFVASIAHMLCYLVVNASLVNKQASDRSQVPLLTGYQQCGVALQGEYALHAAIDLKDVGSKSPKGVQSH